MATTDDDEGEDYNQTSTTVRRTKTDATTIVPYEDVVVVVEMGAKRKKKIFAIVVFVNSFLVAKETKRRERGKRRFVHRANGNFRDRHAGVRDEQIAATPIVVFLVVASDLIDHIGGDFVFCEECHHEV